MRPDHTVLCECGLSEKQARAYLALLELGPSTISPIAERAGLKRTSLYNFIDELVEMGIVGRSMRRGRRYFHAEPLSKLLKVQRERCSQLERAIPSLELLLGRSERSGVKYFEGPAEVRNIMREELLCKKEVLYIWPAKDVIQMTGGTSYLAAIDRERVRKGIQVRSIRFRGKGVKFSTSGTGKPFLREVRIAPAGVSVSMGAAVFDSGKVGFFSSEKEGFGMLVESTEFSDLMRTLFSYLWVRCDPVSSAEE